MTIRNILCKIKLHKWIYHSKRIRYCNYCEQYQFNNDLYGLGWENIDKPFQQLHNNL